MVTLAGRFRLPLELPSDTTNPPVAAGSVSETVHVVFPGVWIERVLQVKLLNCGTGTAVRLRVTVADPPPPVAVRIPFWVTLT
jgi:hypothetical protein